MRYLFDVLQSDELDRQPFRFVRLSRTAALLDGNCTQANKSEDDRVLHFSSIGMQSVGSTAPKEQRRPLLFCQLAVKCCPGVRMRKF